MDRERIEYVLALQEELKKRNASDPLKAFNPHKKQDIFFDKVVNQQIPFVWYLGGNRSGKSDGGAMIDAHLLRYGRDPTSHFSGSGKTSIEVRDRAVSLWVVSQDFPASRDIMQPKIFDNGFVPPGAHAPFIPEREISEWRVADQILKLKNGSICGFKSADSEVRKFYGAGKDGVHFDEPPPKSIYDESTIRIEAGRRLQVWGTCTLLPEDGDMTKVSWIFDDIIEPWKRGEAENIDIVTASIYDNPYLDPEQIAIQEAKYPIGSVMRQIRLDGELIPRIGGSVACPGFRDDIHVKELGDLHPHTPLCWLWDFNVEPSVTHIGQYHNNMFKVFDEIYLDSGYVKDQVEVFMNTYHKWGNEIYLYGDASGTSRTQSGKTDWQTVLNELSHYGRRAKLKLRNKNPLINDRINAINTALTTRDNEARFLIDPKCRDLITDFHQVLLDQRGGIKKTYNLKDPYSKRTHSFDGVTYWVEYEAPVKSASSVSRMISSIKDIQYKFGR